MEQLAPKFLDTPLNADEHHKKRSRSSMTTSMKMNQRYQDKMLLHATVDLRVDLVAAVAAAVFTTWTVSATVERFLEIVINDKKLRLLL